MKKKKHIMKTYEGEKMTNKMSNTNNSGLIISIIWIFTSSFLLFLGVTNTFVQTFLLFYWVIVTLISVAIYITLKHK